MEIKVSIICAAFNHESFIREALESFLMQKTNFKYEILINDDASTDNTASIIKEYENRYPDLVKPVYQTVNQYSQGIDIFSKILLPKAKGKYIALCEGDDFWIDPLKLQKQFDYLESNPECTLCIHNAKTVDAKGEFLGNIQKVSQSTLVSLEDVINGGGNYCATNSIVFPRKLLETLPSCIDFYPIDLIVQMYLASQGETYYTSDFMSAYRVATSGSWSSAVATNYRKYKQHYNKVETAIRKFDEDTQGKYHKLVLDLIKERRKIKPIVVTSKAKIKGIIYSKNSWLCSILKFLQRV